MRISLKAQGSNGEKVWIAQTNPLGVLISYGSAGTRLRTQTIPLNACVNGSAVEEALKRANLKRRKGYEDNRDDVQPESFATPKKPVTRSTPHGLGDIKVNEWF